MNKLADFFAKVFVTIAVITFFGIIFAANTFRWGPC